MKVVYQLFFIERRKTTCFVQLVGLILKKILQQETRITHNETQKKDDLAISGFKSLLIKGYL
jgi:hypothetical protein